MSEYLLQQIDELKRDVERLKTQGMGGAWTDYSATSTIVGWSAYTTKLICYKRVGSLVFVLFYLAGTSNAANVTFTLPFAIEAGSDGFNQSLSANIIDNGANQTHPGLISMGGSTATIYRDAALAAYTASGNKYAIGQFWYIAA